MITDQNELNELDEMPFIGGSPKIRNELKNELLKSRTEQPSEKENCAAFSSSNKRKEARYHVTVPATIYPVLANGNVDIIAKLPAIIADVSKSGMSLWLKSKSMVNKGHLLVGAENRDGTIGFNCVRVVDINRAQPEILVVNTIFDGVLNEVLEVETLMPSLNRDDMQFDLPVSDDITTSLRAVGAINSVDLDVVHLCPRCKGIPTVRTGCSWCLSANVSASKMIHHYGCAHVDFIDAFEHENEMCCPKCRTRKMIVGSDFEYLDGPNMCRDCGQSNLEKILIGPLPELSKPFRYGNCPSRKNNGIPC